jgi:hypothetical protein
MFRLQGIWFCVLICLYCFFVKLLCPYFSFPSALHAAFATAPHPVRIFDFDFDQFSRLISYAFLNVV